MFHIWMNLNVESEVDSTKADLFLHLQILQILLNLILVKVQRKEKSSNLLWEHFEKFKDAIRDDIVKCHYVIVTIRMIHGRM